MAGFRSKIWALLKKVPLHYKTEKYIKVDEVSIALLFKVLQAAALMVSLLPLWLQDAWALTETPGGTVNAWDSAGRMLFDTGEIGLTARSSYCSNPSYSFSAGVREFTTPQCRILLPVELTQRTAAPPSVFFTTAYIETVTKGWPCASDPNRTREAACKAGGSSSFGRGNGQCGCVTQQAVYPVAVEGMILSFEHSFSIPQSRVAAVQDWFGSSANDEAIRDSEDEGLWSDVALSNGSSYRFGAGMPLTMSVEDWLAAANTTLGEPNEAVPLDANGNAAPRRTTGVSLKVDIVYSNMDPLSQRAVPGKLSVHANVRITRERSTWTGLSKDSVWVVAPKRPRSIPSHFHLVERARQGVNFQFNVSGEVYVLDVFVILNVLITALVTMNLARIVADAYTFYLLPGGKSTLLRNKRQELVSKRSEFAEIGLKAALAATKYRDFDPDNNGSIEPVDIVKAFANCYKANGAPWVPARKAHSIAYTILLDADTDAEKEDGQFGLSFAEFITCLEGDAIDFEGFLKGLDMKAAEGKDDREACRKAFEIERAMLPAVVKGVRLQPLPTVVALEQTAEEKQQRLSSRGTLRLHLQKADDLRSMDANGKADPYVIAFLGKKDLRSRTAWRTLEPVWEETLEFRKAPALEKVVKKGLKLQLWDEDKGLVDSDDLIGKVKVSLETLADHENFIFEEPIKPQGTVIGWVSWVPSGKPAKKQETEERV